MAMGSNTQMTNKPNPLDVQFRIIPVVVIADCIAPRASLNLRAASVRPPQPWRATTTSAGPPKEWASAHRGVTFRSRKQGALLTG